MIKLNLLEARMKEKNVWYPELCEQLDMCYQSLYKRIKGKVEFRLTEIKIIKNNIEYVLKIFKALPDITKENYEELGLTKNFTIIDSDDVLSIIKKILNFGSYNNSINI